MSLSHTNVLNGFCVLPEWGRTITLTDGLLHIALFDISLTYLHRWLVRISVLYLPSRLTRM